MATLVLVLLVGLWFSVGGAMAVTDAGAVPGPSPPGDRISAETDITRDCTNVRGGEGRITITSSGTYDITQDLSPGGSINICIEVKASNVVITTTGYSIDVADGETAIDVQEGLENVTVENVTITGDGTGVTISDTTSNASTGVDFDNVTVETPTGIEYLNSTGNVTNSTFYSTVTETAILYDSATAGPSVVNETTIRNYDDAVRISDSSNVALRNDTLARNANGTYVVGTSTNLTVRDSLVDDNDDGLVLAGSVNAMVANNTIRNNNDSGLLLRSSGNEFVDNDVENNVDGVTFEGSSDNSFEGTYFDGNTNLSINTVASGSANNNFTDPVFGFDNADVTQLNLTDARVNRTADGNRVAPPVDRTDIDVYLNATNTSDSAFLNLTVDYDDRAEAKVDEPTLSVWRYNGTWANRTSNLSPGGDGDGGSLNAYLTDFTTNNDSADMLFAPLAAPDPDVDGCRVIDTGGEYNLTGDITDASADACIEITVSGVTLNGSGYVVDGTNRTSGSTAVLVSGSADLSEVTVENLTVTGWDDGIRFTDTVDGAEIRNLTARDNGASGIDLESAENVTVADVVVESSTGAGIKLDEAANSSVVDSSVSGSGGTGVVLVGATNNTIRNNDIENNDKGVALQNTLGIGGSGTPSEANDLVDNVVANNTGDGIELDGAKTNEFRDNLVRNNSVGINLAGAADNDFEDTVLRASDTWSVVVTGSSGTNQFNRTDLGYDDGNLTFTPRDVRLKPEPSSAAPELPADQNDIGIYLNATNTSENAFLDLTVNYGADAEAEVNESKLSVWRHDGSWSDLDGTVDTTANTVSKNVTEFSLFAPLGTRTISECGVVNESGSYSLVADVTDDGAATCLRINASNVTINGQGHTLDGVTPSGTTRGIWIDNASTQVRNVTVRNVNVTGFDRGVDVAGSGWGADEVELVNVSADDGEPGGLDTTGIRVLNASNVTVRETTANGTGQGIALVGVSNAELSNTSVQNSTAGLVLNATGSAVVDNLSVERNTEGVVLNGTAASNNAFTNTTFRDNVDWAVNASAGAVNNSFESPDLNYSNGAASFELGEVRVARADESTVPPRPGTEGDIDLFLNASKNSASGYLDLTVDYDLSGRSDLIESSLAFWHYDGGAWTELGGDLNTSNDTLTRRITDFSTFGPLAANRSIDDCGVIDDAGVYEIVDDISDDETTACLEIRTSNVTVNGGHHLIDGVNGTVDSSGIRAVSASGLANVTVRNVRVGGFETGIQFGNASSDVDDATVENVVLRDDNVTDGRTGRGIALDGGTNVTVRNATVGNVTRGVELDGATDVRVNDSTVRDGTRGIVVSGGSDVWLANATVEDNADAGVSVSSASNVRLVNSTVAANGDAGVSLTGVSDARLHDNTVRDNAAVGIALTDTTDARLVGDTVTDNPVAGVVLDGDSARNDLVNTTVDNATDAVRLVGAGVQDNTFRDATVRNATDWAVNATAGSANNTFVRPDLDLPNGTVTFEIGDAKLAPANESNVPDLPSTDGGIGLYVNATNVSADGYVDLRIDYDLSGHPDLIESSLAVWRNDGAWTELGGTLNTSNDTLVRNVTAFSGTSTFGPVAANRSIDGCGVIDDAGEYDLVADVENDGASSCLEITASNVTLDGNYHLVDGEDGDTPTGTTRGVWVHDESNLTNVTVRNLRVDGFDRGVAVGTLSAGVDDATVANVTVLDDNASVDTTVGIRVIGSENAIVHNATVGNVTRGIELVTTTDAVVNQSNASSATDGVVVTGSSGTRLADNGATRNARAGIVLSDATGTRLVDNAVENNSVAGVALRGDTNESLVTGTLVENNTEGVRLEGATNNTFRSTTFRNNSGWAVNATAGALNNSFESPDLDLPSGSVAFDLGDAKLAAADESAVAAPPGTEGGIGLYVDATNTSDRGYLNLTVNYDLTGHEDLIESSLAIWQYDAGWTELDSRLDTAADTVTRNVTDFAGTSTFGPLAANRSVSGCGVIDDAGTYSLVADLGADGSTCLEITASNVTLDGNYHLIDGGDPTEPTGTTRGVWVHDDSAIENVTVRNVSVVGFDAGVAVGDGSTTVSNATVANVRVPGDNATAGALDSVGLRLDDTADATVRNVTARNVSTGLALVDSTGLGVADATVRNVSDDGIVADGSVLALDGATVTDASAAGIALRNAGGSNVTDANVTGATDGILVNGSTDVGIVDATLANGSDGLELVAGSDSAYVRGLTVENNTDGVRIDGSDGATFQSTTVRNATDWAISALNGSTATFRSPDLNLTNGTASFTLNDARVARADEAAVPDPPGTEGDIDLFLDVTTDAMGWINLSVDYAYDFGGSDLIESSLAVWSNDGEGWSELDGDLDTGADTVSSNVTLSGDATLGPLATNRTITGCGVIDDAGQYVLADDFANDSTGACIEITVGNVTLDGQGARINGTGATGSNQAVVVSGPATMSNVTVRNLTAVGFQRALVFGDASTTVRDSEIANVQVPDDEFAGDGDTAGIRLYATDNVTVRNATVHNVTRGIELVGVTDSSVRGATINGTADGVLLTDGAANNTFRSSTFRDNEWAVNSTAGTNSSFRSPDLGLPNGSVSFDATNVRLKPVSESAAPETRITEEDVGIFLNVTSPGAGSLNLTVNYDESVESGILEDTLSVWRYDESTGEWSDQGGDLDTGSNTLTRTVTEFSVFSPLATNRTLGQCGVIDRSGVWDLGHDIDNDTAETCLEITASDVVLDGQGYAVNGSDEDAGSRAIVVDDGAALANVTVRDVNVTGWDDGVVFGATNATGVETGNVTNVTVVDNAGDGIVVADSANVTVENASVARDARGIVFDNATDGAVRDSEARNLTTGIDLTDGTTAVVVEDNTVADATDGGIDVGPGSDNAVVNNTVNDSVAGIYVRSGDNVFENNTLGNNDDGVRLRASNNLFRNTTFRGSNDWAVVSGVEGVENATFETPDFGFTDGTVTFTLADANVTPTPASERPSPGDADEPLKDVDVYLNATGISDNAEVDLTVDYVRYDPARIEDETLAVWRHDGNWSELGGNVNQSTFTMTYTLGDADLTASETVFAPLAAPAESDFRVTINRTNTPVVEGADDLVVEVVVTNTGDLADTQNVNLSAIGSGDLPTYRNVSDVDVSLEGSTRGNHDSQEFNLTWTPAGEGEDGSYDAEVTSEDSTTQTPVQVLDSQNFSVTIEGNNSPVVEGAGTIELNVTVRNTGDVDGTQNVVLDIQGYGDNKEDVEENLDIAAHSSKNFNLTWTPPDEDFAGNYTAEVRSANDTESNDVQVLDSQNFSVGIEGNNSPVVEGADPVRVTVAVNNTGEVRGTQTVRLNVTGEDGSLSDYPEADTEDVTLAGGASTTIDLVWTPPAEGEHGNYTLSIDSDNETATGPVRVLDSQNFSVAITANNSGPDAPNVEGAENVTVTAEITNTGEVTGNQTLNLTVPGGDGDVRDEIPVTVEPGETIERTFVWETSTAQDCSTGDAGDYPDATANTANDSARTHLRVLDAACFDVSVEATNSPVVEGDTLNVSVLVENTGQVGDTQSIDLTIPGGITRRDNTTVTLNASLDSGEQERFNLSWATVRGDDGDYDAQVDSANDTATSPVTVLRPANVTVVDIVSTNAPVLEGRQMEVKATIRNLGDLSTRQTINLSVGGEMRDSITLTLEGKQETTVTLFWDTQTGDAGSYVANITTFNDTDARDVTVLAPGATTVNLDSVNSPVVEGETMEFTTTVTNTGDTPETQVVTLFVGEEVRDFTEVSLAARESKTVTLTWETESGQAGSYSANVSSANDTDRTDVLVNAPSNFVVGIEDTNSAIVEGDTLRVNATVENLGDVEGTETVTLNVGGQVRASRDVTLGGGENTTVTLTWDTQSGDGGEYQASVQTGSSEAETSITIQRPADFEVSIVDTNSPVVEGKQLYVDAEVRNVGDLARSRTVVLSVGGEQRDSTELTLGGGDEATVRLTWTPGDGTAGNYTAQVASGGESAEAEVGVLAPANFTIDFRQVSSTATAGETVGVTADIRNVGQLPGNQTIRLTVGATERDNATVSLGPGENTTVTLTWQTGGDDIGEYPVFVDTANNSARFNTSVTEPQTGGGGGGGGANQNPTASIDFAPGSPEPGQSVRFQVDANDPDGEIQAIQWRIDGQPESQQSSFSTSFEGGTYQVSVVVTDNDGANARATATVEVNAAPNVEITTAPSTVQVDEQASFAGTAEDPDGTVVRYTWRVNGSVVGNERTLDYTFRRSGPFVVTLQVTDDDGETTSASTTVQVTENTPPQAQINYTPLNPNVSETVGFTADAVDVDGEITGYQWFVDDTLVSSEDAIERAFSEPGTHEVRLVVTDNDGAEASTSVTVPVNAPPTADIEVSDEEPTVGDTVTFEASATDDAGELARYEWIVDGERVSTEEALDYTFDVPGRHNVTLVVTDQNGAVATASTDVVVQIAQSDDGETTTTIPIATGAGIETLQPVMLALSVLTLLVTYLYVRFRQVASAE